MNDSIEPLLALHRKFCEASGSAIDPNDLRFHKHWSRFYWEFQQEGFSAEELVLVIKHIQAQNKKASEPRFRRQIVPSKILGDLARFCEDLAEAKRLEKLRTSPRQQCLNEFRGYKDESVPDRTTSARDAILKAITKDPMTL